jgi:RNA recognition motif-containing protein
LDAGTERKPLLAPFCTKVDKCAWVAFKDYYLKVDDSANRNDMSYGRNECRIYVGNLPPDIRTKDIQDLFYKFGKVTFVDLKNRRGPPFAFVEFEDPR